MKLNTRFALLPFCAAAMAAPARNAARADPEPFHITGLSAGTTPHSNYGHFSFTFNGAVSCTATPTEYMVMSSISQTACSDASVSFAWDQHGLDGATLHVWQATAGGSTLAGSREIPAEDIKYEVPTNPLSAHQYYVGPTDFDVPTAAAV